MSKRRKLPKHHRIANGLGQLSLAEHSLCPLHSADSLVENLRHQTSYHYTDASRHQRQATATVRAARGLTSRDEFFLWGLLALTFDQDQPSNEFHATPHFILRQLGCIDQHSRRGGSAYNGFRSAIKRLAMVTYENDRFYDPLRGEHREVVFGFFSYSLPIDKNSSRAWRFAWDPIFFEVCQATSGRFAFDLETYRLLDDASRRLFLFLMKLFWRKSVTHWIDLSHLAVNVMGYSTGLESKSQKQKINRCIAKLIGVGVIADEPVEFRGRRLRFRRGTYSKRPAHRSARNVTESPLYEPLAAIGFEDVEISGILKRYRKSVIEQWADITMAAKEKHGSEFFKKSPQAYFVNNVQAASRGERTPPDWWHDYRRDEWQCQDEATSENQEPDSARDTEVAFREYLRTEGEQAFAEILGRAITQFVEEGNSVDEAKRRALPIVRDHMRRRFILATKLGDGTGKDSPK